MLKDTRWASSLIHSMTQMAQKDSSLSIPKTFWALDVYQWLDHRLSRKTPGKLPKTKYGLSALLELDRWEIKARLGSPWTLLSTTTDMQLTPRRKIAKMKLTMHKYGLAGSVSNRLLPVWKDNIVN